MKKYLGIFVFQYPLKQPETFQSETNEIQNRTEKSDNISENSCATENLPVNSEKSNTLPDKNFKLISDKVISKFIRQRMLLLEQALNVEYQILNSISKSCVPIEPQLPIGVISLPTNPTAQDINTNDLDMAQEFIFKFRELYNFVYNMQHNAQLAVESKQSGLNYRKDLKTLDELVKSTMCKLQSVKYV